MEAMESAKSNLGSVELPTGILFEEQVLKTITFRELAGPEEDILASNLNPLDKMSQILANCVVQIGNVSDKKKIRDIVDQLLVSDSMYYLVKLRIHSLGGLYHYTSKCPSCGADDKKTYDLEQINVKKAPAPDNLFKELTTPSGRKVRWRHMNGLIQKKANQMDNGSNSATIGIYVRITEVDDKPASLSDVANMSLRDRNAIRKSFEENEAEFDAEVGIQCPKCGHDYKEDLDIEPQLFFYQ